MKNVLLLMMITVFQVYAAEGYSQNTKLTLNLDNVTVGNVLEEIENQSEFYFLFNAKLIDIEREVSISIEDQRISNILASLFSGTGVSSTVHDRLIILTPGDLDPEVPEIIQQQSVNGTVATANGNPLPGVTVIVKGTSIGTITESSGKYSLKNVPQDGVLVFSFIGMLTQEIPLNGRILVDVTLSEEAVGLDEVVVVGYGTASQKKLTTSISRIKSEQIMGLPINNIADAFSGQISGVISESGSGSPGSLPILRIRGYGSINAGSEPLFVIDGMMVSSTEFALLNPKSIENVTFLKDAAAGAIYGSRAGNGVILVTTKKGKYGEAKFSFNSTFGLQQVTNTVDVLDSEQWIAFLKEAYVNDNKPLPEFFNRDASAFANTNWQNEIFRISPYQNYQLSATGGSDKFQYYITANLLDNQGIILTTYSKTYSSNGNFNIELNPKLTVGLSYNAAFTKQRVNNSIESGMGHGSGGYGIAGNIIQQALWFPPIIPVYTGNGDYGQFMQGEFVPYFAKGYANPVANLKETHDLYSRNNITGRLYLNYELLKGLSLNSSIGGRLNSYYRDWHVSPYLAGTNSPYANFSNPVYQNIRAGQENGMSNSWTAETYLDYKHIFSNIHDINFIVGYSMEYNGSRTTSSSASSNNRGTANAANPIPAFDNYFRPNIYGAALILGSGGFGENAFQSIFSRLNYSYKDKYLFMGSIRRDGSSKFAPDNRWGIFPAISGGWRISKEPFMENSTWIDELKLRVSYGISGNDQFGNYAWQGKVNYGNLYTYGNPASGGSGTGKALIPSSIENRNLKWEVNEQFDFGTDISIFGERINLSADYFIRKTKDMLLYRSLPLENGITSSLFDNIGNMVNKGIELSLNTVNLTSENFTWTTNINFTKINNKVGDVFTSTGEIRYGLGFPGAGTLRIIEGRPMFEIYAWKTIGNYETQEQITSIPGTNNPRVGDTIIEDYNDDGAINDDDMQPMGKILADFTFGFNNTLKYKNFDLSAMINGSKGNSQVMVGARQAGLLRCQENTLQLYYDNRYGYGDDLDTAFPTTGYSGPRHSNVSYFIFDASFIRIKNLVLGYSVPENICSKIRITGARVTLGAQNLHTFTKYPFFNPESNSTGGAAGTAQFGNDLGTYPLARTYTIGLDINF